MHWWVGDRVGFGSWRGKRRGGVFGGGIGWMWSVADGLVVKKQVLFLEQKRGGGK